MISESIRNRRTIVGEVSYKGHLYPAEIIAHCVWLYHRFPLSFREVEELMVVRGVIVTYETIRQWCAKFGPEYACRLRRHHHRLTAASAVRSCSMRSARFFPGSSSTRVRMNSSRTFCGSATPG